jgi:porphobilinogen synthase
MNEKSKAIANAPLYRPRRLRGSQILRDAIAEFDVRPKHLILPMFVADIKEDRDISGMPGVKQHTIENLGREIERYVDKGLSSFLLFGLPEHKDSGASGALDPDGVIPQAIAAIRERVGKKAFVITDVCVCSYTDHGHCGVIKDDRLDNDASAELIAKMALNHARAGADMVAPSDMMDGRVGRIRNLLDDEGLVDVPIMSYAVKYASSLYGPFRNAADSAPKFGDRRGYQMDYRNRKDAMREAMLDAEEGADILMVKPGIAYLDIVRDLSEATELPIAAYQVSGEYAMIRYAAAANAIDEKAVVRELWHSFRRAGANLILTYHAGIAVAEGWL